MKKTIPMKRAELFREWLLATIANDEGYYCSTLMCGIPDGDDEETVMAATGRVSRSRSIVNG